MAWYRIAFRPGVLQDLAQVDASMADEAWNNRPSWAIVPLTSGVLLYSRLHWSQ